MANCLDLLDFVCSYLFGCLYVVSWCFNMFRMVADLVFSHVSNVVLTLWPAPHTWAPLVPLLGPDLGPLGPLPPARTRYFRP